MRFRRSNNIFSISILDIDFFKKINDTYGHQAGDYILKSFTAYLSENLRKSDLLGRYGGEEFIIVSYDSNKKNTVDLINKILNKIQLKVFNFDENKISFTFSAGISDISET